MCFYAAIDTNVLVSALLKSQSVPRRLLDCVALGFLRPLFSHGMIEEYKEVLTRPKFAFSEDLVGLFISSIRELGELVEAPDSGVELPDKSDKPFYDVVADKRKRSEAYLVTGNIRHFPREYYIVIPREMLDLIEEKYKAT
ncbi:MAG: PIN domain-containing protein [Bacillota bacterium]|nr:PIN domain-containing protein [Bacillota bacterium]